MINSFFVWNCQGAASSKFYRVLKSLLQGYKPDIVALVEPRISGANADRVIRRIGYPNSHRVEATGYSGGIWLLWRASVTLRVLINHKQSIHTTIEEASGGSPILFTAIYDSPNPSLREQLWRDLLKIQVSEAEPWLLAGDFNATINEGDRTGGTSWNRMGYQRFKNFIQDAGLVDLGFSGPKYTWQRGRLMVRLDRALGNSKWLSDQANMEVLHLPKIQSDHRPLLIKSSVMNRQDRPPFRFLASWLLHPTFTEWSSGFWAQEHSLTEKLRRFTTEAQTWNAEVFGGIGQSKREL
ncbi:uncharacterized protein LOC114711983 [Neltuma alba]|uniref:uncharacterized protein LOC114711983 n=1 Tax=Neltuma alba TaxID=207710 RepID=UPI0010A3F644|nr:uncharacterized protein LOC114711983 [Prosopis alba]